MGEAVTALAPLKNSIWTIAIGIGVIVLACAIYNLFIKGTEDREERRIKKENSFLIGLILIAIVAAVALLK